MAVGVYPRTFRECGHLSHRYWDLGDAKDVRMGTRDRFGNYMQYEPCPEPFERAPDEPPVGTVIETATGRRLKRYDRGWGAENLTTTYPVGTTGTEQPGGSWRYIWETWGPLSVVEGAVAGEVKPSQHCTSDECPYTLSHTAEWCGSAQPRRCDCAFCYAAEG